MNKRSYEYVAQYLKNAPETVLFALVDGLQYERFLVMNFSLNPMYLYLYLINIQIL